MQNKYDSSNLDSSVTRYAKQIINKEINASPFMRRAAKRFINDIYKAAYSITNNDDSCLFYYDRDKAVIAASSIEDKMQRKLHDWQEFFIHNVFGFYYKPNNKRRFRTSYLEMPRRSGMTTFLAAIGVFMASSVDEAWPIVCNANHSVARAKILSRKIHDMNHDFMRRDQINAFFRDIHVCASKGGREFAGIDIYCCLIDDFKEHASNIDSWNYIHHSMSRREQPLLVIASVSNECGDRSEQRRRSMEGLINWSSHFYFMD